MSTKLHDWRLASGYSLSEVSDLTGYSTAMLSRAERGEREFHPKAKVRIARCLAVHVSDLFDPPVGPRWTEQQQSAWEARMLD